MRSLKSLVASLVAMTGVCAFAVECEVRFDHPTGAQITNQYVPCGFIFEGLGTDPPPETYEYEGFPGTILHSHDWYSPMVVRFVDPAQPSAVRPVARIEFDNPIPVDLVQVEVFDSNDQVLATHLTAGTRPSEEPVERIVIDVHAPLAAYMVIFDGTPGDSGWFGPAYTIDNLSTSLTSSFFEDGFESGDTSAWSTTVPGP